MEHDGDGFRVPVAALLVVAGLALSPPTAAVGDSVEWHDDPVEVATGEAFQGVWRMNDSDFRYVDAPSIALDGDGVASVVWADQAAQDIYLQRYDRDGETLLSTPVNISRSGDTFSWLPRMVTAADDADTLYVAWQEIIFSGGSHGGDILFARSTDGGETFSQPINLSDTEAGAGKGRLTAQRWDNGSLDVAEGPDGVVHVAWTEYEGALRLARSRDGGESFADPVTIVESGERQPARGPDLAVDDHHVHVVWTVGEDSQADIHYTRSTDGGETFAEASTVGASEGHADAPKVAVDENGLVHLVYAESDQGPWQSAVIRYSRAGADGAFAEPRTIAEEHAEAYHSTGFPSLAVTGEAVYVTWELFPEQGERPRGLGITRSTDAGRTFAAAQVVPHTADPELGINGSLQGLLMRKLAVNDRGDIAVVNGSFLPREISRVRLIRGRG